MTQNGVVVLVDNLVKVKLLLVDGLLLPAIAGQLTWRTTRTGAHRWRMAGDESEAAGCRRYAEPTEPARMVMLNKSETYFAPLGWGTKSSYSPSGPVLTPSKYSRVFLGRR